MGKIKICCYTCNKEFEKYESKLGKNNFCCRECYLKFHSKEVPICECEICGTSFRGSKYNANRFCSRECYNSFHSIDNKERECPTCKQKFIAKTSEDKYCSWECYNKDRHMPKGEDHWNWKGGITDDNEKLRKSSQYKEWQLQVFQRDYYTCKICNSKKELNAHHLFSWNLYPDKRFDIKNGITLCKKCHILVHQYYGWTNENEMSPDFLLNINNNDKESD